MWLVVKMNKQGDPISVVASEKTQDEANVVANIAASNDETVYFATFESHNIFRRVCEVKIEVLE